MYLDERDPIQEFNLLLERLYPEDTARMLTPKLACFQTICFSKKKLFYYYKKFRELCKASARRLGDYLNVGVSSKDFIDWIVQSKILNVQLVWKVLKKVTRNSSKLIDWSMFVNVFRILFRERIMSRLDFFIKIVYQSKENSARELLTLNDVQNLCLQGLTFPEELF